MHIIRVTLARGEDKPNTNPIIRLIPPYYHQNIQSTSSRSQIGLSLRQFVFSVLAVGVAVGLYFILRNIVSQEEVGWMCILGALPFGMAGFFKYQGMSLERFAAAWIRTQFIYPRRMLYNGQNLLIRSLREAGQGKHKKKEAAHVPHGKKHAKG